MNLRRRSHWFSLYSLFFMASSLFSQMSQKETNPMAGMARSLNRAQKSVVSVQSYTFYPENVFSRVGSGFIVDSNGFIATRKRVIDDSDSIVVTLVNGCQYQASLIDVDPETEVALLKINGSKLVPLSIGGFSELLIASQLAVLGNSIGVFPSVTLGTYQGRDSDDFLLIEGTVPPGNCGSPVIDQAGNIVGVLVGRVYETGRPLGEEGRVNAALSIENVRKSIDFVFNKARRERGWIGLTVLELEKMEPMPGVMIIDVVSGGPADRAGLAEGDTIIAFQGKPISTSEALGNWVRISEPEEKVVFTLKKGAREISMLVRVAERLWNR